MGVYLSTPKTEKISCDNVCKSFSYGASSMQGWRMTQEDAHNCVPDFDETTNTALFAVYDGHGGSEVAQYCSVHLPDFIKTHLQYKEGKLEEALEQAFLDFDQQLLEPAILNELKVLAGVDEDEEDDENEVAKTKSTVKSEAQMLREEADMPLDDLLARYEGMVSVPPTRLLSKRKKGTLNSPMIKGKKSPNKNIVEQLESVNSNFSASGMETSSVDGESKGMLANGHAENENNLNREKEANESRQINNSQLSSLNSGQIEGSSESIKDEKWDSSELQQSNVSTSDSMLPLKKTKNDEIFDADSTTVTNSSPSDFKALSNNADVNSSSKQNLSVSDHVSCSDGISSSSELSSLNDGNEKKPPIMDSPSSSSSVKDTGLGSSGVGSSSAAASSSFSTLSSGDTISSTSGESSTSLAGSYSGLSCTSSIAECSSSSAGLNSSLVGSSSSTVESNSSSSCSSSKHDECITSSSSRSGGGSGLSAGGSGLSTGGSGLSAGGSSTSVGGSGLSAGGSATSAGGSGTSAGGSSLSAGGSGLSAGGSGTSAGGSSLSAGGSGTSAGGSSLSAGGSGTSAGGSSLSAGGSGTSAGGSSLSAGGSGTSAGGSSLSAGGSGTSAGGSGLSAGGSGTSAGGSGSSAHSANSSIDDDDYEEEILLDDEFDSDEDEDDDVEFDSEEEDEEDEENEEEESTDDEEEEEERKHFANFEQTAEPGFDSGCTAVVAAVRDKQIVVANVGDSRCVISRGGKALDLSFDHKPEDKEERARIEGAGGKVTEDGRVNGGLNLSRAIGDHFYKKNIEKSAKEQMITALPDIQTTILTEEDEFMVIACDGIWNYMTSQEVVDFVKEKLKIPENKKRLSKICEEMFDYCLAPNTSGDGTGCDNMTCIIVDFEKMWNNGQNKRTASDLDSSVETEHPPEKRSKISEDDVTQDT